MKKEIFFAKYMINDADIREIIFTSKPKEYRPDNYPRVIFYGGADSLKEVPIKKGTKAEFASIVKGKSFISVSIRGGGIRPEIMRMLEEVAEKESERQAKAAVKEINKANGIDDKKRVNIAKLEQQISKLHDIALKMKQDAYRDYSSTFRAGNAGTIQHAKNLNSLKANFDKNILNPWNKIKRDALLYAKIPGVGKNLDILKATINDLIKANYSAGIKRPEGL